jgi:hypothetical protein
LLDPHVSEILRPIIEQIIVPIGMGHVDHVDASTLNLFCSLIVVLHSISGKSCFLSGDLFPHSVRCLETVVGFLEITTSDWETRFVYLLWLSILVKVPFSFSSLCTPNLGDRIYKLSVNELSVRVNRPITQLAGMLVGLLVNRSVVDRETFFPRFLQMESSESFLEGLGWIMKSMVVFDDRVMPFLLSVDLATTPSKIAFLRVVRYSVPLSLDSVELLLDRVWPLSDHPESRVREKVGKCLSRVLGGMSRVYASQLFNFITTGEYFSGTPKKIHTRLVFLGEVARNKKLFWLLDSNTVLFPSLSVAFGANPEIPLPIAQQFRDSGCVIVWAIARGGKLNFFIEQVLPDLLTLALFDRDINLRRCAAAALQELIGRVGTRNFPAGLGIVDLIDFWSIASAKSGLVDLPEKVIFQISQCDSPLSEIIREKFVLHLHTVLTSAMAAHKVFPREYIRLVARGLGRLVEREVWAERLGKTDLFAEIDNGTRFGYLSILVEFLENEYFAFSDCMQSVFRNVVPQLDKQRLFRGKLGDLVRSASYELLGGIFENMKLGKFEIKPKFLSKSIQLLTEEGIVHLVPSVAESAISAFTKLVAVIDKPTLIDTIQKLFSRNIINPSHVAARRGTLRAVAVLPDEVLEELRETDLVEYVLKEAQGWPMHWSGNPDNIDSSCRAAAVEVIAKFAHRDDRCVTCLLLCLSDTETEKGSGGDSGWPVRAKAVEALRVVMRGRGDPDDRIMQCVASSLGDRYEKVRIFASELFARGGDAFEIFFKFLASTPSITPGLLVHFVGTVSALGMESIMSRFVDTVFDLSPRGREQILNSLESLLRGSPVRVQHKTDWSVRISIPTVKVLAAISHLIPDSSTLHDLILSDLSAHPLPPLASVARLKAVSKLASTRQWYSLLVEYVFLSGVPTVRYIAGIDVATSATNDDICRIMESTDWLSEDDSNWLKQLELVAIDYFAVTLDEFERMVKRAVSLSIGQKEVHRELPAYSEFVSEEHRFS